MNDVSLETLRGVTQRVVDLYTRDGFLFTALDVSNSVKGTLPTVRHREVAPIVRDLFASGAMGDSYAQTLIDVVADRKTVQAFLYHLKGADIAVEYGDDQRRKLAIPPVSASLDDDETAEGVTEADLTVGADGRLRVPRRLLTSARIDGNTVTVERQFDELVIGPHLPFMLPPGPGAAIIELAHPTLLQIPAALASIFDPSAPIKARADGTRVRISGTIL
jgi:hypothetical protein